MIGEAGRFFAARKAEAVPPAHPVMEDQVPAHKFCPSEPDKCGGCETYPLTREYLSFWKEAYADGDLSTAEEIEFERYIADSGFEGTPEIPRNLSDL